MKNLRIAVPLLLLTLCSIGLSAQRSRWGLGPVAGVNFTDFAGKDADDFKYRTGFAAGLLLNYSDEQHFGFNTKFLYSQYGAKLEDGDYNVTLSYFQVPFVATYYFGQLEDNFRPKIFAGPYFAALLGATDNDDRTSNDDLKDAYENFDIGVTSGLGFNYLITRRAWLNVDLLYTVGINDIPAEGDADVHNQGFGLQLGVAFSLQDPEVTTKK